MIMNQIIQPLILRPSCRSLQALQYQRRISAVKKWQKKPDFTAFGQLNFKAIASTHAAHGFFYNCDII
ncbi:MAG: hypothetical protein BGO56_03300 [Sphingobacteriales bacterium 48-107]|nr:MAG: hypothetical protein BGO56_03300 [Sphingobacteriales bacterium 48-107]